MSKTEHLENKEKQWIGTKTFQKKDCSHLDVHMQFQCFPSIFVCKSSIHLHF